MTQSVIGGALLGIIGILLLINPRGVWNLTERWKLLGSADASPAFATVMRIVGACLVAVGALVCFGVLH